MKRAFIILASALLALTFVVPTFAAGETGDSAVPTEDEAMALIKGACDMYTYLARDFIAEQEGDSHVVGGLMLVKQIFFTDYDGLVEKLSAVFTEDVSKRMISDTGYVIVLGDSLYGTAAGVLYLPVSLEEWGYSYEQDIEITAGEDGESAVISFNYIDSQAVSPEYYTTKRSNITAEKVDGEWRVSGGDFLDIMYDFGDGLMGGINEVKDILAAKQPARRRATRRLRSLPRSSFPARRS